MCYLSRVSHKMDRRGPNKGRAYAKRRREDARRGWQGGLMGAKGRHQGARAAAAPTSSAEKGLETMIFSLGGSFLPLLNPVILFLFVPRW